MRRRTLILATAAAAATPMLADAVARRDAPSRPPRWRGAPGASPMLSWRGMPAVTVSINGKGPLTLGIDTGAPGYLSLSKPVAAAIGLVSVGKSTATDPSGKNPLTVERYRAHTLTVAGLTFSNVDADELPAIGPPGDPLAGLLGIDLFDALTLTLDFKGRQVGVSEAGLPPPDAKTVFGYEGGPHIQLPLQIGDVVAPTHLDTGQTQMPLIVPQELVAKLATHGPPTKVGTARTVSRSMDIFSIALDAPVRLGEVRFPVTSVTYPTVIPISNLGSAALQAMTVTIDRPNQRVRFLA